MVIIYWLRWGINIIASKRVSWHRQGELVSLTWGHMSLWYYVLCTGYIGMVVMGWVEMGKTEVLGARYMVGGSYKVIALVNYGSRR